MGERKAAGSLLHVRSDCGQCALFALVNASPSTRPIRGGDNRQENIMLKTTKDDLASKSKAQLAAIFAAACRGIVAAKSDLACKQSLLEMVRTEIAKRRSWP